MLAQNWHEIESWKKSGLYEKAADAVKEKKTRMIDIKVTTSFDKYIYMNCFLVPLHDGGLLLMAHDTTDKLAAEQELHKYQEHLETLVEERTLALKQSEDVLNVQGEILQHLTIGL